MNYSHKVCQKIILIFICVFSFFASSAQVEYIGIIRDSKTFLPLPYVNIGIVGKGIGTVSSENGKFILELDKSIFGSEDILQFSSMGYKTITFSLRKLNSILEINKEIFLEPQTLSLDEVIVTNYEAVKLKKSKLGHFFESEKTIGYWKNDVSLGGELGTKISANKKLRKLNSLSFTVIDNLSDSLLIRINIYDGSSNFPKRKINRKNILFTLKKGLKNLKIDLNPYFLYVKDDFIVSIELLKFYGNEIGLVLAGSDDLGYSFKRNTSQDKWEVLKGKTLQFYLETTLMSSGESIRDKETSNESFNKIKIESLSKNVNGIVFNSGKPLSNVEISVLGKNRNTITDENGRYEIQANSGDVINFSYLGMTDIVKVVGENTFAINVSMEVKIQQLDGVVVLQKKKRAKSQKDLDNNYNTDTNLIKTAYGIIDKETSSDGLYVLGKGDFNPNSPNILDAINGKFPKSERGMGSINNSVKPIFEVDGFIYEELPYIIPASAVERVAFIPGLRAATKYGSIAGGGITIINTVSGNFSSNVSSKNSNNGKIRNNIYDNKALKESAVAENLPSYYKDLMNAQNLKEAKTIYTKYKLKYASSAYFIIDSYNYFCSRWDSKDYANEIFKTSYEFFKGDVTILKAMAYHMDMCGQFEEANKIYKELFILNPNQQQSYLDMIKSHRNIGNYKKALNLLLRYNYLLDIEFFPSGSERIYTIIAREFENLLQQEGSSLTNNYNIEENFSIKSDNFQGTRVFIEWNDSNAQFELQFVDSNNRFFSWDHSEMSNPDMIYNEKLKGYFCNEYLIDDKNVGSWLINAKYLGNSSLTPVYMKITIYSDYGGPNQTKNITTHRLFLKDINQQLLKIDI